jgi:signal transduction histidine kinase
VLRLRIRDDGKGIDSKVLKEGGTEGHFGLRGIRERAQRIGATLDVWSKASAGTEAQLIVPAPVAYDNSKDTTGTGFLRKVRKRA